MKRLCVPFWEEVRRLLTESCERHEEVENFLRDVDDQISCKIGLSEVNEELRGHIEDKAELYMEYGLEEKEAYRRSIRDMGAADVVGLELNRQHRLRTATPLLVLVLALCVLGLAGEVLRNGLEFSLFGAIWAVRDYFYYVWGLLVLFLVTRFGYPILLKHTKAVCVTFLSVLLFLGILYFFQEMILDWAAGSDTTDISLAIYPEPEKLIWHLCGSGVYAAALTGLFVLLLCWAVPQWGRVKENLQLFLYPETQASVTSAWDDSYNNVLIRELLGRIRPFGEIQLSEEELIRYGTSQWYYEDGEGNWGGTNSDEDEKDFEEYVEYRMQWLQNPELRQILPQYYMENYRISWWALRYGWVPALALTILILALPAAALWTAFRIRSRLGQLTAFSCSLVFCLQTVFYLTENLGFQFGAFVALPFVSEGKISIIVSAVLAGLILSAYRYDVVLSEKTAISSDSGRSADRRKRIPV